MLSGESSMPAFGDPTGFRGTVEPSGVPGSVVDTTEFWSSFRSLDCCDAMLLSGGSSDGVVGRVVSMSDIISAGEDMSPLRTELE